MTGFIIAFSTLLMAQIPPAGDYVVVRDDIETEKLSWGAYCAAAGVQETSSKGQTLKVTVRNGAWVATGGGRRFGSRTCEGQNLSLKVTEHRLNNGVAFFKCDSTRVVIGTETTTHEASINDEFRRISFKSKNLRTFRKGGDLCELKISRHTQLEFQEGVETEDPSAKDNKASFDETQSKPKPTPDCNVVGEPKGLKNLGRAKVRITKDKKYCFNIKAVDQRGCVVEWAPIRWRVSPRSLGRISKRGCFRANTESRRTKGKVVARSGRRQLSVPFSVIERQDPPPETVLQVSHPVKKAGASSLPDAGLVGAESGPTRAASIEREAAPATNALRPSKEGQGLPLWLGWILILVALLGWTVYRFFPRTPKWESADEEPDMPPARAEYVPPAPAQRRAVKPNPKSIRKFKVYRGRFTPNPATGILMPSEKKTLTPDTDFDSDLGPAPLREYCPDCGRRYPPTGRARCPIDGALLEPLTASVPTQTVTLEIKGRICNICFERFDANIAFCKRDNVPLMADLGQWDEFKSALKDKNEEILSKRDANVV